MVALPKHDLSQPKECSSKEGSNLMMGDEESREGGGGEEGPNKIVAKPAG